MTAATLGGNPLRLMRSTYSFWGLVVAWFSAACAGSRREAPAPERWRAIKEEIRSKFPGVVHAMSEEVERDRDGVVFVDVRPREEFEVSRIPGALHVPQGGSMDEIPRNRPVIVYCSVGYRSAQVAEQLQAAGYTNVRNYLGSIFEWANRGGPLEDDAGVATRVHPYSKKWGELLRAELR